MSQQQSEIALSLATAGGERLAKSIRGGEILALSGELGSGKTTFTKAFGKALGVKQTITSPTFVLMQEFPTNRPSLTPGRKLVLYHLDLYRTQSFADVASLDITQIWGHPETVTVIEWAEKIDKQLPAKAIRLHFYRDTNE